MTADPAERTIRVLVQEEADGQRLDAFLAEESEDFSRSYVQKLIREGHVTLLPAETKGAESVRPPKVSTPVHEGQLWELQVPPAALPEILPQNIPLDILYEDEALLVVNKPKGMVVHPAPGHPDGTLVNALLYHCAGQLSGIGGVARPGIVHRIDRDTTGSLLVCKTDVAHQHIAAQLKEHSIHRVYHAICRGILRKDELTVDAPLGRSRTDRKKMAVLDPADPAGKPAVTHVRVLERFPQDQMTYVACRLETGRTHQIRVHLSHLGYPLLGDEVYGSIRKSRFHTEGQCLHAKELGFLHPVTETWIQTDAPLPSYFKDILSKLR